MIKNDGKKAIASKQFVNFIVSNTGIETITEMPDEKIVERFDKFNFYSFF